MEVQMLQKLVNKLQQLNREPISVNLEKFDDPLAQRTEWTPAKSGGSNFRTHKLVEISTNRLEFRPSVGALLFSSLFAAVGAGVLGAGIYNFYSLGFILEEQHLFMSIFGIVFLSVGLFLFYQFAKPAVFDTMYGYYWKGRKKADFGIGNSKPEIFTSLNQIHAIQIIAEYVRGNKSSYYSYELNLVLKDGSRKNVIDHGSISKLREDADKLARFLGKPIWDGALG